MDLLVKAMLDSNIVKECLAILRLEAIRAIYPDLQLEGSADDEAELVNNLNSKPWFEQNQIDLARISAHVFQNQYLQDLPPEFPVFKGRNSLLGGFVSQSDLEKLTVN